MFKLAAKVNVVMSLFMNTRKHYKLFYEVWHPPTIALRRVRTVLKSHWFWLLVLKSLNLHKSLKSPWIQNCDSSWKVLEFLNNMLQKCILLIQQCEWKQKVCIRTLFDHFAYMFAALRLCRVTHLLQCLQSMLLYSSCCVFCLMGKYVFNQIWLSLEPQ